MDDTFSVLILSIGCVQPFTKTNTDSSRLSMGWDEKGVIRKSHNSCLVAQREGGMELGRPTKSALESRVEWGIERGGGETSRIFCSKAKFPTNISAEKEFLRRQRINQAMMKGKRAS